jgi:hypothetical protein
MARAALFSLLALGSAQLRPSGAGAVPAFVARHLPAGLHRRGAAADAPRCSAADGKPWSGRDVPDERIRVFLVRHGAGARRQARACARAPVRARVLAWRRHAAGPHSARARGRASQRAGTRAAAVDLTTPGMTFPKNCFYGGHNVPLSAYGEVSAVASPARPQAPAAVPSACTRFCDSCPLSHHCFFYFFHYNCCY